MGLSHDAERDYIESNFPRLTGTSYEITSPRTFAYNCIAWATGETHRRWWPDNSNYYWPDDVPNVATIAAFAAAFESLGYEECSDGGLEFGFEKVALYAIGDVTPVHASRQLSSGQWTSKLGGSVDISHGEHDLSGSIYGTILRYFRRRIGD